MIVGNLGHHNIIHIDIRTTFRPRGIEQPRLEKVKIRQAGVLIRSIACTTDKGGTMTDQSQIRLGLVGAGPRGRAIIETLDHVTDARLVRVSSSNPETRERVAPGCQIFPDWRPMLDSTALDGLIIATPPATHFAIAHAALAAGLPVLMEEPLAMTVADAVALKEQAGSALIMVNHTHLAHPAYRFIKELVTDETAGPIRAIRGYAGLRHPDVPILWTWGAQELAMCIDLLDTSEPEDLSARLVKRQHLPEGSGETIELRFDFAKGTDVRLRLSNILEEKTRYFAVHFDRLTLIYDGRGAGTLTLHPSAPDFQVPEDEGQRIELPTEDPLFNVLSWFTLALANGVEDLGSLNLGMDVVFLLARCQAMLEGKDRHTLSALSASVEP